MPDLEKLLREIGEGGVFRTGDLEALGMSRAAAQRLVERGEAEQISHGLYRLVEGEITEHIGLVVVQKKIPDGIICLLSALQPIRIVRFSGVNAQYGVETRELLGVPVRITSITRTVIDCFRYRNKIGIDVALEALKDVLDRRLAARDEILRTAEACRAKTVIRPYLEAMSA